jgi:hypothetical protein
MAENCSVCLHAFLAAAVTLGYLQLRNQQVTIIQREVSRLSICYAAVAITVEQSM